MWDLPGPGIEPVSPALAGGFLTTAPPGKPPKSIFNPRWVVTYILCGQFPDVRGNTITYLADGGCLSKERIFRIVIVRIYIQQRTAKTQNNSQQERNIFLSYIEVQKKTFQAWCGKLPCHLGTQAKNVLNSCCSAILEYCPHPPKPDGLLHIHVLSGMMEEGGRKASSFLWKPCPRKYTYHFPSHVTEWNHMAHTLFQGVMGNVSIPGSYVPT